MDDDRSWVFLKLDESAARRSGMPVEIPLMKKDMAAVAEQGLTAETVRKAITAFQRQAPSSWRSANAKLAARYDVYVGKATFADRAAAAMKKGDVDATIKELGSVTRLDKEDHGARMNLGVAYAQKGDVAAGLRELVAVEASFEGETDYHCARGQMLASSDDKEGAIDQFVLALEAKPDNKAAMDALVKLGALVVIYEDPRDPASLSYLRADALVEHLSGLFAEAAGAASLLEQIAYHESEGRHAVVLAAATSLLARTDATDAERERAETARIAALGELGRHDEARVFAEALVAARPGSPSAHVELARSRAQAGDADAARAELDRALELDPGDQQALTLRFWPADRTSLKDVQEALPALAAFVEAHPSSAGAHRSLARAKLVLGALDDALAMFQKAVDLSPADDDLRAELWAELSKAGRNAEVVADADRLGDMPKRSGLLRWSEAAAYEELGKKMEAQAAFAALSSDDTLHATLRKRARRAAARVVGG
jgi:tetratricopeptide (TPR) repeat protein